MKIDFNKIREKIYNFIKKRIKLLLFILVFVLVCLGYNQNSQTLNHILKRGTILEYSCPYGVKINEDKIKDYVGGHLRVKFYSITSEKLDETVESGIYDSDEALIEQDIFISIPILARSDKQELFNNISKYIFDNYPNSKLINVRSASKFYHVPFGSFLSFLGLLSVSFILYLILLYALFDFSALWNEFKKSFAEFLKRQKEGFSSLIQKTKEKGFSYFLKRLLFDESENNEEVNVTKEIVVTVIFVLLSVIVIRYFIGELRWIPSGSMRPTIVEKDRVFVEKIKTPDMQVQRGDILVFYPPETKLSNSPFAIFARLSGIFCKDVAFIKRTIGMPNDKLEIKYNEKTGEYRVYINDKALNEPYINSRVNWTPCSDKMFCGPMIIPEGHYFMMGDNRGNSQDSRFWGFLDKNRIIGRANFMFFPISRINVLGDKYIELYKQKSKDGYETEKFIVNRYEFLYNI